MPPPTRERTRNTVAQGPVRAVERPVQIIPAVVAFSEYVASGGQDGFILHHRAPCSYYCKSLLIGLDNTTGGRIRFRVGADEYVEKDVVQGDNTIQVERIIPEGTKIRLQLIEGTTATGVWMSWNGIISA